MKTAQEMYQYSVANGFGEGTSEKWSLKHFLIIEDALQKDEDVIMSFIGLHNYISPTKHDNNFAYAITNKRILMAQQKMIGQVFQSVLIDNLNDITMSTSMFWGIITVDTIKETFNVGVGKGCAVSINEKIHDALHSLKEERKQPTPVHTTSSSADEIIKFKKLLDDGIITQEEFDKKKKQLLGV